MTKAEIVIDSAYLWWQKKRPVRWSLKEHLSCPMINCLTEWEKTLAGAVADYVQAKGQKRRKTVKVEAPP